jgi:hypothetical protein
MRRRLFLLPGLAIMAVVANHVAGWGFTAMFWWTDCYRSVDVPNFDLLGSPAYYALMLIKQLTVVALPAFLFVSGYFVSFSIKGRQSSPNWKMARTRVVHLLIPYLVWSFVMLSCDALEGSIYSPGEYLTKLFFGQAYNTYFYVPAICQLYLLSPLVVSLAKTKRWLLIAVATAIHVGIMSLDYSKLFYPGLANQPMVRLLTSYALFTRWILWFALGTVCGLYSKEWLQRLVQWKWVWATLVVVFGVLTILEPKVITAVLQGPMELELLSNMGMVSENFYALALVFGFLAFADLPLPFPRAIGRLGSDSYGLYLVHGKAIEVASRVIRQVLPALLAYQALFVPLLFAVGLGVPLLAMEIVRRTPLRRYSQYLFG